MTKTTLGIKKQRAHKIRIKIRKSNKSALRLSVHRSNKTLSLQIIDDRKGITLASAYIAEIKDADKLSRMEQAEKLGELIAKKAEVLKIATVVFDRGSFAYHGLVKTAAESARTGGLKF